MDFEGLAQKHTEAIIETLTVLKTMVADNSQPFDQRLKAAKMLDSMSMTVIMANLSSEALNKEDRTKNKLISQLEKLKPKDEE